MLHHGVVRGAGAQNSDVLSGRKEMGLAPLFRQRGNAVEPYGVRRLPDADDWRDAGLRQRDFRPVFHDGGDCHVRRETGKQAVIINEIVQKMFVNGESITDEELKELVGHTHVEVIGGVIVGLLTAGLFLLFM